MEMPENLSDLGKFAEPGLLILISLADGEKHGYAMMQDIEAACGARIGPGTLYAALARLEGRGWIESIPSDDRRRPYRLTTGGAAALRRQLSGMANLAATGLQRLAAT
jgi:DNA-binding PadR family transcriptional regulator